MKWDANNHRAGVLALIRRPSGATVSDVIGATGISLSTAWQYMDDAVRASLVIKVRVSGQRAARYFGDAKAAAAWRSQQFGVDQPLTVASIGSMAAETVGRISELIGQADGASMDDLISGCGVKRVTVEHHLGQLRRDGKAVTVRIPGDGKHKRHFGSQAGATAWLTRVLADQLNAEQARREQIRRDRQERGSKLAAVGTAARVAKAGAAALAVAQAKSPPPPASRRLVDDGPVDDSRAKRTVIPTPLGRYEVAPGCVGPFGLVGVGRDVRTGKPWRA